MSQIESDFDLRQSVNIYPTNEALEKFHKKKKNNNSSSTQSSSDMNLENDHETKDEILPSSSSSVVSSEVVIPTIREEVTLEELMGGMKMNPQNQNQTLEEQELKIFNLQDAPTSNLDEQFAQHLEESQESEFKFTPSPLKDSSSQTKKK